MPRPKNTDGYACESCGRQHTSRQARHNHKARCGKHVSLLVENAQLKEIIEMYKATGLSNAIVVASNASNASNAIVVAPIVGDNNNINVVINTCIRAFGKEDLSCLTKEYVIEFVKSDDFNWKLQQIIRYIYCNRSDPQNMNVFVPNKTTAYVFREIDGVGMWVEYDVELLAIEVAHKIIDTIDMTFQKCKSAFSKGEKAEFAYFKKTLAESDEVINSTIFTFFENHEKVDPKGIVTPEIDEDEDEDDSTYSKSSSSS